MRLLHRFPLFADRASPITKRMEQREIDARGARRRAAVGGPGGNGEQKAGQQTYDVGGFTWGKTIILGTSRHHTQMRLLGPVDSTSAPSAFPKPKWMRRSDCEL
jgi:hypothetical protein